MQLPVSTCTLSSPLPAAVHRVSLSLSNRTESAMKQIKYICLIICLMSVSVFAAAPVGTATGQFLTIGVGGRAVAMGESITAATMGSESVFWNPAGLCEGSENDLFAAYNQWPAGIHVGALSATYNSPTFGAFALHAK